jgi:hypothetical protein
MMKVLKKINIYGELLSEDSSALEKDLRSKEE